MSLGGSLEVPAREFSGFIRVYKATSRRNMVAEITQKDKNLVLTFWFGSDKVVFEFPQGDSDGRENLKEPKRRVTLK